MKSIMHNKEDHTCYLCMMIRSDYDRRNFLEEHHVFNGPNRKLSEKYGLKVYLCHEHHTGSMNAIHKNANIRHEVQKMAQIAFIKRFPDKDFMKIFGKNYL